MKKEIFESLVEKPKTTKKWLYLPLSLLVHGFVIASLIVVPLMSDMSDRPPVRVVNVMLAAVSPPQPPAPPAAPKSGRRKPQNRNNDTVEERRPTPIANTSFVAPVEIPDEIPEEDFNDFGELDGEDFGVIGGVPNGDRDGVIGSALLGGGKSQSNTPMRVTHVTPPRLIKKVKPSYPSVAIKAHVMGNVIMEAVTDIYGRVQTVRIISGHPLLRTAAEQAVRQWIYEPYIMNGVPKPVIFTVVVNFTLSRH